MSQTKEQKLAAAASNYAAVKSKIESDRLLPWSSAPSAQIGEFEVNPLSVRSMVDLQLSGNAIVGSADITAGDLAAYIWRHLKGYNPDGDGLDQFLKLIGKCTNYHELIADSINHFLSAFKETAEGASTDAPRFVNTLPAIPDAAFLCDEIAAEYSMDPRAVADMPLALLFQLSRAIRMRLGRLGQGPVYRYLEPKELRDAAGETLKILNDGKN